MKYVITSSIMRIDLPKRMYVGRPFHKPYRRKTEMRLPAVMLKRVRRLCSISVLREEYDFSISAFLKEGWKCSKILRISKNILGEEWFLRRGIFIFLN